MRVARIESTAAIVDFVLGIPEILASPEGAPQVDVSHQIKVSNPPNGGFSYIGHAHAARLVKQGRAEFDRLGCLRLAARTRVSSAAIESGRGYDQVRRAMTSEERRAIPLVGCRA